ncbi:MAG: hypothetical protein KDK27_14895, partial [Leptospiraceae bacterium]|nr:hypothetical protein [Leptospiraceae bacterium]
LVLINLHPSAAHIDFSGMTLAFCSAGIPYIAVFIPIQSGLNTEYSVILHGSHCHADSRTARLAD